MLPHMSAYQQSCFSSLFFQTVESGCGQDVLPLVRLVVSPSEEEEGEEREDVLLNDLIMQQDFEM